MERCGSTQLFVRAATLPLKPESFKRESQSGGKPTALQNMKLRLPHPFALLLGAVAVAALLTWVMPTDEYQRHKDEATGREVVAAGTYAHPQDDNVTFVALKRKSA